MNSKLSKLISKAVENWPGKVLSIGLAIVLFVFYRISILETRYFFLPLNIEQSGTMMPSNLFPRIVRVSLRGEANSIYSIQEDDIEVFVDMSSYTSRGTYMVPVQWRTRTISSGMETLQVTLEPMEISFNLDYRISRVVPVIPNFRGQLDSGFTMTNFSLNPSEIIIDGPAELMAGIYGLYSESIDLGGRRTHFTENLSLINNNPLIVIRGEGRVDFRAEINQIVPVRNISMVPVFITGLGDGLRAELDINFVNLNMEGGNHEEVERFLAPDGFVRIDLSGIVESGTYVLNVLTGTAEGITFRTEPNEITVQVSLLEE